MDGSQARVRGRIAVLRGEAGRQRIDDWFAKTVERGAHEAAEHALRDAFGEPVHGHDAARVQQVVLVAGEEFVFGIAQREAAPFPGRTREESARARFKRLREIRLAETRSLSTGPIRLAE